MELYTTSSPGSRMLQVVATACQLVPSKLKLVSKHEHKIPILSAPEPALQKELRSRVIKGADPKAPLSLNHPRAIARFLVRVSRNEALLGKGPLEEALTDELMSIAERPVTQESLDALESIAARSTYLGSPAGVRVGDLAVYAALHPYASANRLEGLPAQLRRWFALIQNHHTLVTRDGSRCLPLLPVPSPPPSPLFASKSAAAAPAKAGGAPKQGSKAGARPAAKGAAPSAQPAKGKKEKKDKAAKKAAKKARLEAEAKARAAKDIGRVDFRVGKILACEPNASDASLYVSTVSLGGTGDLKKQVVSRLGEYVPLEKMKGATVVLIVNLPDAEFGGTQSQGRILCGTDSKDAKKKVLVTPPAGVAIGERVQFAGAEGIEADTVVKDKKLRPVMKKLAVVNGIAQYAQLAFKTSKGNCTVPGIAEGTIA